MRAHGGKRSEITVAEIIEINDQYWTLTPQERHEILTQLDYRPIDLALPEQEAVRAGWLYIREHGSLRALAHAINARKPQR